MGPKCFVGVNATPSAAPTAFGSSAFSRGELAVLLLHPIALLLIPAFVGYMSRFQIAPEERALEARFGKEFKAYAGHVRRWL